MALITFKKSFLFYFIINFYPSTITCSNVCSKIAQPASQSHDFSIGFKSLKNQFDNNALTIEGTLPQWLAGSFVAIGPGIFELNTSQARHWLDGFGLINKFTIDKTGIYYTNKLIDSSYYKECCKTGKIRGGMPEKKKSTWSKLTSALGSSKQPTYDNANINIHCFNNQLVALTETPNLIAIDHKTLATKGNFAFNDTVEAHFSSAHPLYDPETKEWFGFAIQYGHTSNYIIYSMKEGTNKRIVRATIPVGYPAYMHSFGLTKNYIILTEAPFVVSPYDLLLTDNSFIETFNWQPKNGTRFIVINRKTGKKVGSYKTDAFFTLHHVNAFEKNNTIVIDLVAYKSPEIVTHTFTYKNLSSASKSLPVTQLKRYIINPKTEAVTTSVLSSHMVELPHINHTKLMQDYNFVYATCAPQQVAQQLIKLDLKNNTHHIWQSDGCYPTEPIFIAKPQANTEDDGVILSLVLDAQKQKSFLLVLDAKTLKEHGRAYAPCHIPFTLHSKFLTL